jgi:hypothetical protein
MTTATLGASILIADMSGDRPAIITRADSATMVEACAFMPLPVHIKVVKIHSTRAEAINATQRDTLHHGYWTPKA